MTHQDAREAGHAASLVVAEAAIVVAEADIVAAEAAIVVLEGKRIRKVTLAVGFADLTDADGSQTFPFAAALPAGAAILGFGIDVTVGFTDGVAGVFTADLGVNGGNIDAWLDGADIASIAKLNTPQGIDGGGGLVGAITPSITVLADVNVGTATAGALVAELYYVDAAALD